MPTIYNYHHVTKEYTGSGQARPSPREPGVFLVPADATTIAPPNTSPDQVVVWDGVKWKKVRDKRKENWYDPITGKKVKIDNPEMDVANLVDTAPPPELKKPKIVGGRWVEDGLVYKDFLVTTADDVWSVNMRVLNIDHDSFNALHAGVVDPTTKKWTDYKVIYDQFVLDAEAFITSNGL